MATPKVATMPLDEDRPFLEQLEEAAVAESEEACAWVVENVHRPLQSRTALEGENGVDADHDLTCSKP